MRKAYIAAYTLREDGEEDEVILFEDTFWSGILSKKWDELYENFKFGDKTIRGWYSDEHQTRLICALRSE